MSNTDGEDTKLRTTRRAVNFLNETGYADQAMFNIKERPRKLSEILEMFAYQELASLREQLAKEQQRLRALEMADNIMLKDLREQVKEKDQQLSAVLRNSTKLMDQLKQKEDENRELKQAVLHYFDLKLGWGHENAIDQMKAKESLIKKANNLSA